MLILSQNLTLELYYIETAESSKWKNKTAHKTAFLSGRIKQLIKQQHYSVVPILFKNSV